jgi:SEC-C motif-containing protein
MSRNARCPCHSRKKAHRCCGPYLSGKPAPTPTALMRSRFAAYAVGRPDYIMATTDPSGPGFQADTDAWIASIEQFTAVTRFRDLSILDASPDTEDTATVTFLATLDQAGQDVSFSERSTFHKGRDGRWRYHSGTRLS